MGFTEISMSYYDGYYYDYCIDYYDFIFLRLLRIIHCEGTTEIDSAMDKPNCKSIEISVVILLKFLWEISKIQFDCSVVRVLPMHSFATHLMNSGFRRDTFNARRITGVYPSIARHSITRGRAINTRYSITELRRFAFPKMISNRTSGHTSHKYLANATVDYACYTFRREL